MEKRVNECQAIILCGGKGERLRPLTSEIPKPLIPIKGKPILSYILDHIMKAKIKEVVVCTGYKSEKVSEYFESNKQHFKVNLVDSGDADIIKRIKDAAPHIKDDFIVLYGDTLSDVDLQKVINFHKSKTEKATITVWPLRSQFGLLELDSNSKVTSFKEKPLLDKWINIGYFYFEYEVLGWMNEYSRFEDFLNALVARGELNAYQHLGLHITVNTLKELEEAEENVQHI